MPFKIRVAESAGFCFGVRKALDKLIEIRNQTGGPVRTLGPLIHNEQVLEALKKRSVIELGDNEEVAGKHVVLRAHGVTPEKRKQLQEQNAIVCDATCPKVGQVQAIVKKFARKGCPVLIIGDRGHAEVDGLLGYSGNTGFVVTGPEEAGNLTGGSEVCVVAQTTQDPLIFEQTVEIIRKKYTTCHEFNTICDATSERQAETQTLAGESDIMVVVGGKHSANTRRLAEIASKHCKTVMIQTVNDISPEIFVGVHRVGVTAGASTPAWVIRKVVERIRILGWEQSGKVWSLAYTGLDRLAGHPACWALGLGLLALSTGFALTGFLPWITAAVICALTGLWRIAGKRLNPGLDIGILCLLVLLSVIPINRTQSATFGITCLAAIYFSCTYLSRLLLFDCLNVQADKISGCPTFPAVSREKTTEFVCWLSTGIAAISVICLMITGQYPLPIMMLAIVPAGFGIFQFRRLKNTGWCSLCDNLYLNAPVWIASILSIVFRLAVN